MIIAIACHNLHSVEFFKVTQRLHFLKSEVFLHHQESNLELTLQSLPSCFFHQWLQNSFCYGRILTDICGMLFFVLHSTLVHSVNHVTKQEYIHALVKIVHFFKIFDNFLQFSHLFRKFFIKVIYTVITASHQYS